jgi:hypothetical protein
VIVLGVALGAIGLGDLVAGLSGRLEARPRPQAALAVTVGSSALLGLLVGLGLAGSGILTLLLAVASAAWMGARRPDRWSASRATATLWGVAAAAGLLILTSGLWPEADGGSVARWLVNAPFPTLQRQDPALVIFAVGAALWLLATGNALVRLLLAAVGTDAGEAEQHLRGGRIIGPMERVLIFGFLLAGQATAAALVVSAKSLLRFPEMRAEQDRIDVLTEYFLVGSFASWLLALVPVPFAGT